MCNEEAAASGRMHDAAFNTDTSVSKPARSRTTIVIVKADSQLYYSF